MNSHIEIYKNPNYYRGRGISLTKFTDAINMVSKSSYNIYTKGLCNDIIGKSYFDTDDMLKDTSLIFILYEVGTIRSILRKRMRGFIIAENEVDDKGNNVLYIDAICARYMKNAGSILLEFVENYANTNNTDVISNDGQPYKGIKLSSLSYVINYYRSHQGYKLIKHVNGREPSEVRRIANANSKHKFKSEDEVEKYLSDDFDKYIRLNKKLPDHSILNLLTILTKKGYSKNCDTKEIINEVNKYGFLTNLDDFVERSSSSSKSKRGSQSKSSGSSGDELNFYCMENGFTMIKKI